MAFDEAGNLLLAEAGRVEAGDSGPISPIVNHSSRVIRIAPDGQIATIMMGLPYTNYIAAGDIGAADVTPVGDSIYILTGEGFDDERSRAVLRVAGGGPAEIVVNIREFIESIAPPDSRLNAGEAYAANPFAMVAAPDGRRLYISDGASGRVLSLTPDGTMRVFAELPGKPPLTGLAFDPTGRLHVALLGELPLAPGNGAIYRADADGKLSPVVADLNLPIDVGFDAAGQMYALEFGDGGTPTQPYMPGSGRLLRLRPPDPPLVILDQLNYPTAMAFSATGDLYIALNGAFSEPTTGSILKVACRRLGRPEACRPVAAQ
jgi:DNA-binding beta-propeller fold protein YncE